MDINVELVISEYEFPVTLNNSLGKWLMKYLDMKYSPKQIANAVRSVKVCTSTIYN